MGTLSEVREAMLRRCRGDMPSWPDPHVIDEPTPEEYSRVTNGQRYQIVVERAHAWAEACAEVLQAQITPAESTASNPRGWTLTSPRPFTSPLHVRVFEYEHPGIRLGCGSAHEIETMPDCGCDACDSGSEDLLEALDDWFANALTGGLAHIWGDQWSATRYRAGWGSSGAPDAPAQLDFDDAGEQLDEIAAGRTPSIPPGLRWVWSGRWIG